MNTKLDQIRDWPQQAKRAGWSVKKLADLCDVSMRVLQRHFTKNMGLTPKAWMKECRQRQAVNLLQASSRMKEKSAELGYKHPAHFSQDFKKHWGCCPTKFNQNLKPQSLNPPPSPPTP